MRPSIAGLVFPTLLGCTNVTPLHAGASRECAVVPAIAAATHAALPTVPAERPGPAPHPDSGRAALLAAGVGLEMLTVLTANYSYVLVRVAAHGR